jgi:bifunctional N-acetylglucosamine-1-phosphate-uridyltransferase/glucosamine-1-phosphate-acetyltransferase GlmU-like protein
MICPDVSIEGDDIAIDRSTIILPKVSVISSRGITTTTTTTAAAVDAAVIGRNNVIEECCLLADSTIGDENWIGIGAHIIQVLCSAYPVESFKVLLPPQCSPASDTITT